MGAIAATSATVTGNGGDNHTPRSRQSRSVAPVVARVDSDLANWPAKQPSVRHIHGGRGGSCSNLNGNNSSSTGLGLGIDSVGAGGVGKGTGVGTGGPSPSIGGAAGGLVAHNSVANTPSPRIARTPTSHHRDGRGGAGSGSGNITPIGLGSGGGGGSSSRGANSPAPGVNGSPVHGQYRSPAVGMAAAAR